MTYLAAFYSSGRYRPLTGEEWDRKAGTTPAVRAWLVHRGYVTIKRHATGKGNASKDMVIASMRARGHTPADDNEADALALLHLVTETGLA